MAFHVGQEVVCIKREPWRYEKTKRPSGCGPVYGEVCTVHDFRHHDGFLVFANHYGCYKPDYFRPVVKRKTDISIFTKMLTPAPKKELVE
jgi:hypothetical protein